MMKALSTVVFTPDVFTHVFQNFYQNNFWSSFCVFVMLPFKTADVSHIHNLIKIFCIILVKHVVIHNPSKFHSKRIKIKDFREGGSNGSPPYLRWPKKPMLCRVKANNTSDFELFEVSTFSVYRNIIS